METLQHIFPLHQAPPSLVPPTPAQRPPSPPAPTTPQMPNSPVPLGLWEAHMVMDLSDSLEVVVISIDDKPMEDLDDHLEADNNLEEDLQLGGSTFIMLLMMYS